MKKSHIVGIGEALWDVLPEGKKIGGAPANFAFHMSQFGYDAIAVSAVGDDDNGRELRDTLQSRGMKYLLPELDRPTGTVNVTLDAAGIPQYVITENVAWATRHASASVRSRSAVPHRAKASTDS